MLVDLKLDSNDIYFDEFIKEDESIITNVIRGLVTSRKAWQRWIRHREGIMLVGEEFSNTVPENVSMPLTEEFLKNIVAEVREELSKHKSFTGRIIDVSRVKTQNNSITIQVVFKGINEGVIKQFEVGI